MTIHLHKHDIPDDLAFGNRLAVDTETMGLNPNRDPLCVVQISGGDGEAHIIQLNRESYDAPNLKALLADETITKIYHFARFDLAVIKKFLDVDAAPVFCTRTASKLVRTYTDRHGLRDCCRQLLGVDLNKQQQSSDWGAQELSQEQLEYAANDVLHLHALQDKFEDILKREGRRELAQQCFDFLSVRARLDLEGWADNDIFAH